jgi:hypothetical protein
VELHPHAIAEKVRIMVEHFAAPAQNECNNIGPLPLPCNAASPTRSGDLRTCRQPC